MQYLDIELSDVMSLGDLTALKLRLGCDTAVNKQADKVKQEVKGQSGMCLILIDPAMTR